MSAGYIQLVALGQQDAYLTGSPQVTYFSGVYKRHTPFVLEAYDIAFNDQIVTYGGTSICRIPPKGDLIRGLTLKATLPALYNPGNDWTWPNPPSNTNYPILWLGLPNGTITGPLQASYGFSYYSSNAASLNLWDVNFLPYLSYIDGTNSFQFSGVSNVIVQQNQPATSAFSGVFWGFDPVNYSTRDNYGNLVYNATTSGIVTPDFNLQQAGWVQTQGIPVDPLPALYLTVAQPSGYPMTGLQFINFSSTNASGAYWTPNYALTTRYTVTPGGCIQFARTGYYAIRAGFNLTTGSIQSVSYGTGTVDGQPVGAPTFLGSYNYTVSPDPSSPTVIPIVVTSTTAYYYFYTQSTGTTAFPGTYFSIGPVNETYQLNTNINLPGSTNTKIPFYGNVAPLSQYLVTLAPNSEFNFTSNAQYVISGSLSLSGVPENYVTNVGLWSNIASIRTKIYSYDMTLQGRNPTYAFSLPLVASNLASYYVTLSSTRGPAIVLSNSFVTLQEVGLTPYDSPTYSLPQNGIIFRPKDNNTVLPATLNFRTQFSNTSNSTMIFTGSDGSLVFANTMSYMLTGVLSCSNLVTSISISNSQTGYAQSFALNLGIAPPYTISVPFNITNNALSYSVTLQTDKPSSNLLKDSTFLAVYPLTSNEFSNPLLTNYSYCDSVGTYLIQNADLKIGGQTIQSITGEYIEIWNELNVTYENQPGLQLLTGKYDTQTSVGPPGRTYYVNLPFYFYGSPELSIPICALDRQDVEVWVTFRPFSNLTSFTVTNPTLQATIITEYAYLSNPEINWFQSHQIDYIITQTQYDQFDLQAGFTSAIFELFFKNPVKELFFIIQPVSQAPYDYSNNGLASLGLTFNGEDAFLTRVTDTAYVGSIEPFNHHTNFFSIPPPPQPQVFGRQFFMYAFSTNPSAGNPSGSINFSRIHQVMLELNIAGTFLPAKSFRILATSQNILRVENGIAGIMFN